MIKCECGVSNDEQARYCESCGINLRERCPNLDCRAAIRAHQKFCRDCGTSLASVQGGAPRAQPPAHLAQQILGAAGTEGERKIVTLLFADLANSTELISNLDGEEANRILEPTLDRMIEAVHRYQGTVTHTAGDGIMAIFGAPIAHEDHAVRACYAALDIHESMRLLAADVRREFGVQLQVRVGINSGPVVVMVKAHGENVSVDYRAVGRTTHVAARLQGLAAPGTTLLTRETFALAKGFIRTGAFEPFTIRGLDAPIEVCELHGVNTRMRFHALAARDLSKFVGREEEIEMLGRAAAHALAGRGQVVGLVGEAGVGKSRLFWEFGRSPAMHGWLLLEAGSVSYGKATSFLPLIDLMSRYFDIQARDEERRAREKISGKLFALGEKKLLAQTSLFLGALGWGGRDQAWTALAPAERQKELFSALKQLLIRESQEQPLCLVFEDLHWIDAETQNFLDGLLDSLPAARVLLLVNFRPEYNIHWARKSFYSQARIDPLPALDARELLDALLGPAAELAAVKDALFRVTEGNPLFLEESVRSLVESGVLSGMPGQFRPTGPLPAAFLPQSIEALLAARIDRLPPRVKEILQCAAVIGHDIPHALLAGVAGLPKEELEKGVHELEAAEFLYEKQLFPETEYTFKHSMTREVAYSGLLRERRRVLHAHAAHALLQMERARADEHVERVAQHAELGGLWEMAVEYLQRAGKKAFALYANVEAADFFERAVVALRHLPSKRTTLELGVDLRIELRNALLPLAEVDRILAALQGMEPILEKLGDKARSARHAAFRCNHHFLIGEQRRAIEYGEAGLQLARAAGERAIEGELLYRVGQSYYTLGEYRRAIELLRKSVQLTGDEREDLTMIPSVVARTWLAIALTELGEFAEGMIHAKRALAVAEHAEHQLSQVLGWLAIGHLLLRKGEFDGAVGALERGMELCERWSLRIWRPRVASSLGVAYARAGRSDEGLALARQAVTDVERMRLGVDKSMVLVRLGQAALLCGQLQEAEERGRQAVTVAEAHEEKGYEAWARFLVGRASWAVGPKNEAEAASQIERALDLARACGARPLVAYCQSALGAIRQRGGDEKTADELAAAADATYAQLGMRPLALELRR